MVTPTTIARIAPKVACGASCGLPASLKKKSAVALARQLAIDLWRWRTGRATAAELGWVLKSAEREV
jgi:hypothetical protein